MKTLLPLLCATVALLVSGCAEESRAPIGTAVTAADAGARLRLANDPRATSSLSRYSGGGLGWGPSFKIAGESPHPCPPPEYREREKCIRQTQPNAHTAIHLEALADARPASAPAAFDGVSCFDIAESDGVAHLLLGRSEGEDAKAAVALSYLRSNDGGATWSAPVAVPTAHAPPAHMHRGDDPQLAARGNRLIAVWPAKGDGPYGSGPLGVAVSEDGGSTWSAGQAPVAKPLTGAAAAEVAASRSPRPAASPADTRSSTEAIAAGNRTTGSSKHKNAPAATGPGYRFPAVAASADAFHLVWIYAAGEERSLRHARLNFDDPRGPWSDDVVIDPQICACCWNELRVADDGSLCALYRDVNPSDMATAASRDNGATWHPAGRPGPFNWQFEGCPHVGGGLAPARPAAGASTGAPGWIATVWTGAAKSAGAYATATNTNGGDADSTAETANWSRPLPLGDAARNTDLATSRATHVTLAVWDQSAGEAGQSLFAASSRDGGRTWSTPRQLSRPARNAAYPRVVPTPGGFHVAWTVYGIDGRSSVETMTVDDRPKAVAH